MIEYLLYKTAYLLVRVIPLSAAYRAGVFLSFFYFHFFRRAEREILKENLRNVFPSWDEKKIKRCARQNFREFGKFLAEFFYLGRFDEKNIKKIVQARNFHYMEEARSRGRGVIGLAGHMGNWELGSAALSGMGCRVHVLALDHENKKINNLFISQRKKNGVGVISVANGTRRIFKLLKRGDFVAILGDRDVTSRGVEVDFCGKRAVFPRGAPTLCCRTGAPLLVAMMVRQKHGRYSIIMHKPLTADDSLPREEAEMDILNRWVKLFEGYVKAYPEQWFMYHRVFKQ